MASVHKANRDGNELIPGQPVVNARTLPELGADASAIVKGEAVAAMAAGKRKQAKALGKVKGNATRVKGKS